MQTPGQTHRIVERHELCPEHRLCSSQFELNTSTGAVSMASAPTWAFHFGELTCLESHSRPTWRRLIELRSVFFNLG